ncbi:MAG TPA: universal stress protein, partial [Baekduia sp.]|nr:universal stress protein [Baekduia sp.]
MTLEAGTFDRILVGVDGRSGGRDAIALARVLAGRDARLVLVHVWVADALTRADHMLDSLRMLEAERKAADVVADVDALGDHDIASGLRALAERHQADLLVLGAAHRSAWGRLVLGDVGQAAVHALGRPVAVAPAGHAHDPSAMRVVGAAFNGTAASWPALDAARALADAHGAHVRAL